MTASAAVLQPAVASIASRLGLTLPPDRCMALIHYLELLQRWNTTYNLTSVREPQQMLSQHVADCLAVVGPLARQCGADACRLLDVGSGGGLPGAVIAIVCPGVSVTCVDTVGKKAAFVQQVAIELQLSNLRSAHARVENLRSGPFDVVTARAFATLSDLVRLTRNQLTPTGVWMAMKGKPPDDEIRNVPADVSVFHVEPLEVPSLQAQRCLVWMRPSP